MRYFTPIYNMDQYRDMKYQNKRRLDKLADELSDILGYPVSPMLIRELSLLRTLDCYDLLEVVNLLKYYGQLKDEDNEDIQHILKRYIQKVYNDIQDQGN